MITLEVLSAPQIAFWNQGLFLYPHHRSHWEFPAGFRSDLEENQVLPIKLDYCNTQPSRPIPSSDPDQPIAVPFRRLPYFPYLHWSILLRGDDGEWPSPIDLRATEEDVKLILDLHNDLRQKIVSGKEIRGSPGPQPAAGFIPNLKWSEALANAAWVWAQHLRYKHGTQIIVTNFIRWYSLSTFVINNRTGAACIHLANTSDWTSIINGKDGWSQEVDFMNCGKIEDFRGCQSGNNGKVIGHYTQMVWAETTHVGCAAIGYYDDYNGYPFTPGQPYKQFYVCNYSPRGNATNKPVYKVDYASSSDCPNYPE
ncbi:venom allergen 5-like [Daphnia pulicaria]|uniref:venom allergen 5-like n=1 Tax=Daphnia pulicaria TaxID=35523 RepID=UPI001EEAF1E4|nr:venom allergen 5-like [Daphnia pulicaria]